ncbi:hypothetical protein G6F68_011762 [Rhizopus microsporus]|nr:hypothetical protein G6F68_011762 [Rhizopus microsporus]
MVEVGAIAGSVIGSRRRVAAQRDHAAVGGFQRAADAHAADAIAIELQAGDVLIETELDAGIHAHLRQAAGEQLAVAGLVTRQAQRADQAIDMGQGRFGLDDAGAVQHFVRHAVLGQDLDVLRRGVQLLLGAEQLGGAQVAAFELDADLRAQLVQAVAAVLGHAHHARLVDRVALVCAVAQHLPQPAVLGQVHARLDRQRRVLLEQPADGLLRHARGGPRRGVAERQLPGIGEAGFQRRTGLAVDDRDFKPGLSQVPGTGGADHAAAEN